jgi:mono/diheme cytochrome c family protein/YHS domain-containing protein
MRSSLVALGFACLLPAQEPAVSFVRDVAPILQEHCISCHGPDKQKGGLRLDRKAHALPEDGSEGTIVQGDAEGSELVRRLLLPDDDEELMPQQGGRLGEEQVKLLRAWIDAGAEWPEEGDRHFAAAEERARIPKIDFGIAAPAPEAQQRIEAALVRLRERGAVALQVAQDTPAIDVNASLLGAAFTDQDLALLADLGPTLVWLNLARTGVTDAGLGSLAALPQLRRLNLSGTAVGDDGMAALARHPRIETLNVYGAKVTDQGLLALAALPELRKVYAFDTAVTKAGAAALAAASKAVVVDLGDYAAQRLEQARQAIEAQRRRNEPIHDKCIVSGAALAAEHFVVHEGVRVGFCCGKCKKKFLDDPAAYADKLAEWIQQKQPQADTDRGGEPSRQGQ